MHWVIIIKLEVYQDNKIEIWWVREHLMDNN